MSASPHGNQLSPDAAFLSAFESSFGRFKDLPIALYGIGEKTRTILEGVSGFNFVGLMDRETVGSTVYNHKVLSYTEAAEKARLIIIVANMTVSEIIYRRISFLNKRHGIKILFINGTAPIEIDHCIQTNPYWDSSIDSLKAIIDLHNVISFDIFDTLIMRNVLIPAHIFDIVERDLTETSGGIAQFKILRIKAEKDCFRSMNYGYNIHHIYQRLQHYLSISDEHTDQIKNLELNAEMNHCILREAVVDCFNYALDHGKTVCLTSDTYFPREIIKQLFDKLGVTGYHHLFLSCELNKSKHDGDMWKYLQHVFEGKEILHIGDNSFSDIEMAEINGIHTYGVKSAYDLLEMSSLGSIVVDATHLDDNVFLGQFAARFLNNPFHLNKTKGYLPISDMFSLGYMSFGPLVLNYLIWLINMVRDHKIDTLLFFARDGFILHKLYEKIIVATGIKAPRGIYFLTSRRAASVASLRSDDEIAFVVHNMCKIKKIKIHQLLYTAFGIPIDSDDQMSQRAYYEFTEQEVIDHILQFYKSRIIENAQIERAGYAKYIERLKIPRQDKIGIVNYVGSCMTQRFVSKLLGKNTIGYYFATYGNNENPPDTKNLAYALYGENISLHTSTNSFHMKFLFGEVVFSSPDCQLVKFDSNGLPIYQYENAQRCFSKINECHAGIEQYIEDMMNQDGNILQRNFDLKLIDKFYGLFSSSYCITTDDVRQCFIFSDYYDPETGDIRLFVPNSDVH